MPWFWVGMPNNPQHHNRRDEVRRHAETHGATLHPANELLFDPPHAYALIEAPDQAAADAFGQAVRAHDVKRLHTADEL